LDQKVGDPLLNEFTQIALAFEVRLQAECPLIWTPSKLADNCDLAWCPKRTESLVRLQASRLEESSMKKKIMGTNKHGPPISRTVVSPGDDPKHELVVLMIRRDTTTSSDPDWNETEQIVYGQEDQVAETGTHRGYFRRLRKNGETDYGTYEGTHKTSVKEDGSWETTWEGTWKSSGGTGKFKNMEGGGTYRGKATAQEAFDEFEGDVEY
jgi:hypothetical protein